MTENEQPFGFPLLWLVDTYMHPCIHACIQTDMHSTLTFEVGTILWTNAMPSGTCEAANCSSEKLNGRPGLECRCRDGYRGLLMGPKKRASTARL